MKIEEAKEKLRKILNETTNHVEQNPPPRYDDVFLEGQEYLNAVAKGEIDDYQDLAKVDEEYLARLDNYISWLVPGTKVQHEITKNIYEIVCIGINKKDNEKYVIYEKETNFHVEDYDSFCASFIIYEENSK